MDFPEPTVPGDRADVLLRYLDYFRGCVTEKIRSLPAHAQVASVLPSGWTPLQLAVHLRYMERRWLVWGFVGEPVDDPWGDAPDGQWVVPIGMSGDGVLAALLSQGERTRDIVTAAHLHDIGAPGPRWDGGAPATLERVLLHVLQEYARHLGQLDVVVELTTGDTGE
ncbi:DUF664 domain-containing protein [uncultured Jatrophihabitans sp.]|uniref:mycothiol transferase n=1 Tax=uncultured Jatrophihabitans sp. TaxID=1610747 RepID=UPI0035C9DE40